MCGEAERLRLINYCSEAQGGTESHGAAQRGTEGHTGETQRAHLSRTRTPPHARTHDTDTKQNRNRFPDWG